MLVLVDSLSLQQLVQNIFLKNLRISNNGCFLQKAYSISHFQGLKKSVKSFTLKKDWNFFEATHFFYDVE